jgi:hypothetical protein
MSRSFCSDFVTKRGLNVRAEGYQDVVGCGGAGDDFLAADSRGVGAGYRGFRSGRSTHSVLRRFNRESLRSAQGRNDKRI